MKDIPMELEEQDELPSEIKFSWQGKLRSRVTQRQREYSCTQGRDDDGNFIIDEDAEPYAVAAFRTLRRQKTNVVIKTVEEAYALHRSMAHYADDTAGGVTWMNGPMTESAKRVQEKILNALSEMDGVEYEMGGVGMLNEVRLSD